ncbi:MAG: ABC-ATPase domain-containing protein [Magnetococcales bacterium]|nr:ABC-ATPase domain-containing protein [Magnetococcales bacterium]
MSTEITDSSRLESRLDMIDGKGYKAYHTVKGVYQLPGFILLIDHIQGDPFADPSRIRVRTEHGKARLPPELYDTETGRRALEDFLLRQLATAISTTVRGNRGSGKSGVIAVVPHGQTVLKRNAVLILDDGSIEARIRVGLPANGRRIAARHARIMLLEELPLVVEKALLRIASERRKEMTSHVACIEDQHYLRHWIKEKKLAAFVADGSTLPRASGIDDSPLTTNAVPFRAPESLARTVTLPHAGTLRGLAIPLGITLIVGGGFHGKSTLLKALEQGVYDHIPGDGRERVVTTSTAVTIRAEDGRAMTGVDISPFIKTLPGNRGTTHFSSSNASGSTSQAANTVEAVRSGATLLLVDEDTAATNFMIRDARMQALIHPDQEPIIPFSQQIRRLYTADCVSTILVMGGSSAFFDHADTVLSMVEYHPHDVTQKARSLCPPCTPAPGAERRSTPLIPHPYQPRLLDSASLTPPDCHRKRRIRPLNAKRLLFHGSEIDASRVSQLVDRGQLAAIGYLLRYCGRHFAQHSLETAMKMALDHIESQGLDTLSPTITGELALPRLQEAMAVVNRYRELRLIEPPSS